MSHGQPLWLRIGEDLRQVVEQVLHDTRRRVGLALLVMPFGVGLLIVLTLASVHSTSSRPSSSVKGDMKIMAMPKQSSNNGENNSATQGGATGGQASNSSQTDINVSTNMSGGTTSGSITINGQTQPLSPDGSLHEHLDTGNVSVDLNQSTTSSSSGGSSQHTHIHSRTSTFINSEDD